MSKASFHVAIVGAGLGGLAAAIGIARAGHRVTVIEQAPALGEVGYGIQVPPNSTRIFNRWGLLEKLEAGSIQPTEINIHSYRDGKILSNMLLDSVTETVYGYPYLHIHRADYHKILVDEVNRLGVRIQLNSAVTGIDFETPSVHIKGHPDMVADIIIGADGLKSVCRESLLRHPDPPHITGDLAYRLVIKGEDIRKHPVLSSLTERLSVTYWIGPGVHVIGYLLRGGQLYNVVIACPDNLPEHVNVTKADIHELQDLLRGWDPQLLALLEIVQETSKWRLQNSEEMKVWSHPSGKFVLLGDACHATLPYLAQGAAQAIEDGAVLGHLFEKINHPNQLSDLLIIYEAIRKPRTSIVVKGSSVSRDIFHMRDGPIQEERDRQLLEEEPFEGYPNRLADPVFQNFLYGYDATERGKLTSLGSSR